MRRRVLIVEDHPDTCLSMSLFLSREGYDVTVARTLAKGLSELDQPWDVLVSDIGLGDGSGLELARRARALDRRPPTMIALSGYGSAQDIAESRQAGFDYHLVKPVDMQQLLGFIEAPAPGGAP
jgi:DNA-binding response OmpR family regulator